MPPGPDNADKAPHHQLCRQSADNAIAADNSGQPRRQISVRVSGRGFVGRHGSFYRRACHWRDKAVALAGDIHHVASTVAPVTERFSKTSNMHAQVSLLDRHIRPDARDQLLACEHFAWPFNQCDQDVECAAAERDWLIAFL